MILPSGRFEPEKKAPPAVVEEIKQIEHTGTVLFAATDDEILKQNNGLSLTQAISQGHGMLDGAPPLYTQPTAPLTHIPREFLAGLEAGLPLVPAATIPWEITGTGTRWSKFLLNPNKPAGAENPYLVPISRERLLAPLIEAHHQQCIQRVGGDARYPKLDINHINRILLLKSTVCGIKMSTIQAACFFFGLVAFRPPTIREIYQLFSKGQHKQLMRRCLFSMDRKYLKEVPETLVGQRAQYAHSCYSLKKEIFEKENLLHPNAKYCPVMVDSFVSDSTLEMILTKDEFKESDLNKSAAQTLAEFGKRLYDHYDDSRIISKGAYLHTCNYTECCDIWRNTKIPLRDPTQHDVLSRRAQVDAFCELMNALLDMHGGSPEKAAKFVETNDNPDVHVKVEATPTHFASALADILAKTLMQRWKRYRDLEERRIIEQYEQKAERPVTPPKEKTRKRRDKENRRQLKKQANTAADAIASQPDFAEMTPEQKVAKMHEAIAAIDISTYVWADKTTKTHFRIPLSDLIELLYELNDTTGHSYSSVDTTQKNPLYVQIVPLAKEATLNDHAVLAGCLGLSALLED
jgi:hypothetical protein